MCEKKSILLIEDNDADIFLIERALARLDRPFEIGRFKDGSDALPALLATPADTLPDLILLDVRMPRSNGLDILRQIRSTPKLCHIPVGLLTSSIAPGDRMRALTLGATRYIHKESSYDDFIGGVGKATLAMLKESDLNAPPPDTTTSGAPGAPDAR